MALSNQNTTQSLTLAAVVLTLGLLAGYGTRAWQLGAELQTPAGQLKLAEKALDSGHPSVAMTLFEGLAKKGDPAAEYWVAHMKDYGIGTPKDTTGAIALYVKASQHGNADASARLGDVYLDGVRVPQDFPRARTYLEQAARKSHVRAATELGRIYASGLGVLKDTKTAYAWYAVAVIEGSYIARHERDQLIAAMSPDQQQLATAAADRLLTEIKAQTSAPVAAGPQSISGTPAKSK